MTAISVRPVSHDELPKLLALYKHLHPDDPDISDSDHLDNVWNTLCQNPHIHCLAAEVDGSLVSSCTLVLIPNLTRGVRPYGLIENVVTDPAWRKNGYGKAMLEKAVSLAREANCYKVMLLTGSKKEETLRFYENAGFVRGIKTGFVMNLP